MKYVHVLKNETDYRSKLHEKEIRIWVLFQQCCSFRSFLFQHIRSLSASLYLNIFQFFCCRSLSYPDLSLRSKSHTWKYFDCRKKNQQRKWTSVWVAQEILLPNVLHILEKLVPCKTYSSSIFHRRSKKKVLIQIERKEHIFLCRVKKTKYFHSTRL